MSRKNLKCVKLVFSQSSSDSESVKSDNKEDLEIKLKIEKLDSQIEKQDTKVQSENQQEIKSPEIPSDVKQEVLSPKEPDVQKENLDSELLSPTQNENQDQKTDSNQKKTMSSLAKVLQRKKSSTGAEQELQICVNADLTAISKNFRRGGLLHAGMRIIQDKELSYQVILKKNVIDIKEEEDAEACIIALRKITKKPEEIHFLKKALRNLDIFKSDQSGGNNKKSKSDDEKPENKKPDLSSVFDNDHSMSQLFKGLKHQFFQKRETIFHFGEHGVLYYIVLIGEVFTLVPNSLTATESQHIKRIKNQQNDGKTLTDEEFLAKNFPGFKNVFQFKPGTAFGDFALLTKSKRYNPPLPPNGSKRNPNGLSFLFTHKDCPERTDFVFHHPQPHNFLFFRSATMVCKIDTHVMTLSKQSFDQIIGTHREQILSKQIQFFKNFPFLAEIPNSSIMSNLLHKTSSVYFKNKDTIYQENDLISHMYFIKQGEVSLSKNVKIKDDNTNDNDDDNQNNFKLLSLKEQQIKRLNFALLGPNMFFGDEEQYDTKSVRNQRAICASELSEIYIISRDRIFDIVKRHSQQSVLTVVLDQQKLRFEAQIRKLVRTQIMQNQKQQQQIEQKEIPTNAVNNKCMEILDKTTKRSTILSSNYVKKIQEDITSQNQQQEGVQQNKNELQKIRLQFSLQTNTICESETLIQHKIWEKFMQTQKKQQSSNQIENIFNERKDLIYGFLEKDKRKSIKNEENRTISPDLNNSCSNPLHIQENNRELNILYGKLKLQRAFHFQKKDRKLTKKDKFLQQFHRFCRTADSIHVETDQQSTLKTEKMSQTLISKNSLTAKNSLTTKLSFNQLYKQQEIIKCNAFLRNISPSHDKLNILTNQISIQSLKSVQQLIQQQNNTESVIKKPQSQGGYQLKKTMRNKSYGRGLYTQSESKNNHSSNSFRNFIQLSNQTNSKQNLINNINNVNGQTPTEIYKQNSYFQF